MQPHYGTQRDRFIISTDRARLNMETICDFLTRAYWAQGRPRRITESAFANSLVFGVYDGERQIGMARVISDYAIFAYLLDVFIDDEYRGRGLGQWLIETVLEHPQLKHVRRWMLSTQDAHELYARHGFGPPSEPGFWMERLRPFPEET